ncbi:MAG: transposase [Rubellimicrobium sp.]|nr:transposase [Rubellimicrobium sp.]
MDAHEDTPRIQVLAISDTGRRRRFTDDEKLRIVEESYRDGVTAADVARRHEISRSMIYDWRHRQRLGLLGSRASFMRVVAMEEGLSCADAPLAADVVRSSALTIDLGGRCRVTVPADFDLDAAARLLNGLMVKR